MSRYHYPVPADEVHFEELVLDLFNAEYKTDSFELYKHRGNNQYGIDLFSRPSGIVVQCKKKDPARKEADVRNELLAELRECVTKAQGLPFDFKSFVLATTSKKYSALQDLAIELSSKYPFSVRFMAWTEIERLLNHHAGVRQRHFPGFVRPAGRSRSDSTVLPGQEEPEKQRSARREPIPGTIGRNPTLKASIQTLFNRLGDERAKRFGKSAFIVMYKNFKTDFGIKSQPWTCIWDWPEATAPTIRRYLEEKYMNTIAGRREARRTAADYVPSRPQLFAREAEILSVLGLRSDSPQVRTWMHAWFGVSSHRNLSNVQHWHFVLLLEAEALRQRQGGGDGGS